MLDELAEDGHVWVRIADASWADPCDPTFAASTGGRWNPPGSFPVLYLNEDVVTARINLRLFIEDLPYGPEDLADRHAPVLVSVRIPRAQRVADVHSSGGVGAVGLPATYPLDKAGTVVPHETCQPVGVAAKEAGLRGVRCRSARAPDGAGRELAWFPATARSRATIVSVAAFADWFWT